MELSNIIEQLNEVEKKEVSENNISSVEHLLPILLKRVTLENVDNLAKLLTESLLPSVCDDKDEELARLFKEIKQDPTVLFKKEVQKKIEDFIKKRFEKDKNLVIRRTSDISKFVVLMGEYLNEAISNSGSSSQNVLSIKEKIEAIDITSSSSDALSKIQIELINAASSIEVEMTHVTEKLQSGKSKVEELEEKVKSLEDELSKTKSESRTDHLTGLLTRRAYSEEIKKVESAYLRTNSKYAIVFFDLDHFKNLNDTYGHECGDVVLSTFGKILSKYTRDHDVVCRYGGEEFVAIIHFNENKELLQYLKRMKSIVSENSFVYKEEKIRVTFSAGVSIRNSYENYKDALQKADNLLYEAKDKGRNRIILENGMEI